MLALGDAAPDATVWLAPQEQTTIRTLVAERPLLLVFYLFST
jgi:hypothetical protein